MKMCSTYCKVSFQQRLMTLSLVIWFLALTPALAQIVIGGKVFGGGNAGDTGGNTNVTIYAGDLNEVYGGARQANVGGHAFVNIDGEHMSDDVVINYIYGGNDISGTIGSSETIPTDIPADDASAESKTYSGIRETDLKQFNAFILTTKEKEAADATKQKHIFIGQLFGGSNGDYTYTQEEGKDTYTVTEGEGDAAVQLATNAKKPDLGKTFLDIRGGTIGYTFGGGNNATLTEATHISINNQSAVTTDAYLMTSLNVDGAGLKTRMRKMGLNTATTQVGSADFQFGRVFGGNNKAEMAIRPSWHLKDGKIRDLYSGGNKGDMTCPDGLFLNIDPGSTVVVDNVYGGCRMADVCPKVNGVYTPTTADIPGYSFPHELAARTVIAGGDVNNVYGGNDISGKVYGGNAVGIRASVRGNVYGGGNGSYAYTDNSALSTSELYGDLYYNPGSSSSIAALNAFRPNAEQVSIRLVGTEDKPTIIHGGVFCGGNSATIESDKANPVVELKIGSYVVADSVFLGNNGANMVDEDILRHYAQNVDDDGNVVASGGTDFSNLDLTDKTTFETYMEGAAMRLMPSVVFDTDYQAYTTYIGSLFCGGNVGSMIVPGKTTINFGHKLYIYNKVVGGCNNANIYAKDGLNAEYLGGLLGAADGSGNKLELNFNGLLIQPKRWKVERNDGYQILYYDKDGVAYTDPEKGDVKYVLDNNGNPQLEWNTISAKTREAIVPVTSGTTFDSNTDPYRRLLGGNVYGGCYNTGHVNGNVIININESLVDRNTLFDVTDEGDILYENVEKGTYTISERKTGVILSEQGMDVLGAALNVFGGGYGLESEIWGSATINLNKGYAFQFFGGGEKGAIGKKDSSGKYTYDAKYSTYINLNGGSILSGVARGAEGDSPDMAECEFVYGGAFEGAIAGDTHVNLNNGRIFNSFAGSCNADILGHTETYVGRNGFPWIRDHIYGGNDLGGRIHGNGGASFGDRIRDEVKSMVAGNYSASAYMEYTQGRVRNIVGGCYGNYDYEDAAYSSRITSKPYLRNAFVNFRPVNHSKSEVAKIFGAGEGYPGDRDGDKSQDFSYVLIDIPENVETFQTTEVFGAGAYDGLGMRYPAAETFTDDFDLNTASAVIDLLRGRIGAAYGGSLDEGVTRRTLVNVPSGSTIKINNIFGGAYGNHILPPCDVYEANVNYRSGNARVNGSIYGGNNNVRRTIYATVNVSAPVLKENGYNGTVFGAGKGLETWAEYTEVNLESGANVYEAYGGSEMGNVLNAESVEAYMIAYAPKPADKLLTEDETEWKNADRWEGGTVGGTLKSEYQDDWQEVWKTAWTVGDYFEPNDKYDNYVVNNKTNLQNTEFVRTAEMDDRDYTGYSAEDKAKRQYRYNTNVIINEGATVGGYVYGGGLGDSKTPLSGGIYGSTYVAVLGGTVAKDVYAAGTSGSVSDVFGVGAYNSESNQKGFTASANVYVKGGTVRNVYGGGWEGHVGHHEGAISASTSGDRDGETHVVVGVRGDNKFLTGAPAVTRNVYGGGEGGSVYGKAYVTVNNGHIGYRYVNGEYKEELDEKVPGDNVLDQGGNVFGGGYVVNSYTDASDITMWGGQVRGCLYGGGELGPIGRGTTLESASTTDAFINGPAKIYKGGEAHVTLYGGHVMRNVFGGGRGFDNWNGDGTMFMSKEVRESLDLSSKGYVFGSTDVRIRGGEVGTHADVAHGLEVGNVFGGGNQGFVYSATGTKHGDRGSQAISELSKGLPATGGGYYYKTWYDDESQRGQCELSLDCNVVVEPYCLVKEGCSITIGGTTYSEGEYVPLETLNQLKSKNEDARWEQIDYTTGVTIHNAVFAGGNVTVGSDQMYVNTGTVFGNVTAALRDVYHRDLITIGTEHTGGIYGDGNLTMVDGWREIHIDNYGTDYYTMETEVSKADYESMSDRERAYFVLNYKTNQEITDTKSGTLAANKRMTLDEIKEAFDFDNYQNSDYPEVYKNYISEDGTPNPTYFTEMGFCSIYAGRLLNTIQRCDMAAVWGSRIVLQGARDRVPEKADYTRYTLNRVGELSLNQRTSEAGDPQKITVGSTQVDNPEYKHGNYFGIYSVVNYLGNLTSDVFFTHEDVSSSGYTSIRTTDNANSNNAADGHTTYYDWKVAHAGKANRNNATSPNKVCLASGVYLELIREESEKSDKREWGLITGVVELDLIDVKTGLGGGYVYARNQHGVKTWHSDWSKVNLSPYNEKARTYKRFTYDETESTLKEIETSGNFVHNTKQIIDDCYPNANAYKASQSPYSEAHYWYIKGLIYVYDQYISAYTGSANAYAETVNIPLTIAAASHGRMTLRDVQPNLYAYKGDDGKPLGTEGTVIVGDITYRAGDPIDYWTYSTLSDKDQNHFVKNVYTTIAECTIGNDTYPEGSILLPSDIETLRASAPSKEIDGKTVKSVYHVEQKKDVPFDYVFRVANKIGHDAGFVLTYDVNNPSVWNNYYTQTTNPLTHINTEDYAALTDEEKAAYTEGPTYKAVNPGVYGQRNYEKGEIISAGVYNAYQSIGAERIRQLADQATAERAYVITEEWTGTNKSGTDQHLYEGTPVFESDYTPAVWAAMPKSEATLCSSTLQLSETEYVYAGDLLSTDKLAALKTRLKTENSGWTDADVATYLNNYLSNAYYITKDGAYGGRFYETGKAYLALDAWCSLTESDRNNFRYNYDALDLLIDPTFGGEYGFKPQYDGYVPGTTQRQIDGNNATAHYAGCTPLTPNLYSKTQPIDYEAEFSPTAAQIRELGTYYDETTHKLKYVNENNLPVEISTGYDARIKSTLFEDIPNERAHWSPIIVSDPGTYYVVKEAFINGDLPYTVGQQIDATVYNSLTASNKGKIRLVDITDPDYAHKNEETGKYDQLYYYYCREPYTIGEKGEGKGFHAETNNKDYTVGETVDADIIIKSEEYDKLVNLQKGFIIHGSAPEETTTLYVSRETDIFDLQKEKIITVIYMYEYQESDESGNNITPVSERHIVNIHINFESGAPEIGPLTPPGVVLPGTTVGLKLPRVEPGAFEISSSGWEIFDNKDNATLHVNGQPYQNNTTPMYWYQNGYWVAYYAQTYLGKTYSEPVQFTVANYHDMDRVMQDTEHHMYVDNPRVKRNSKIYIDNRECVSDETKSELDLFSDFFNLSTGATLSGHSALDSHVTKCKNLDFILYSDVSPKKYTDWTPIGTATNCFAGWLHGNGYTVSGLNKSLFGTLCGNIYNIGVTGSFTSGGIADSGSGHIENTWVSTTATPTGKPIIGDATDNPYVYNSYYPEEQKWTDHSADANLDIIEKPMEDFVNGEVAYLLNSNYLQARYLLFAQKSNAASSDNKVERPVYFSYPDGTFDEETVEGVVKNKEYQLNYTNSAAEWPWHSGNGFVEDYMGNGDFRYSDGIIPKQSDVSYTTDQDGNELFIPVFPDDYIYFGQVLSYDLYNSTDRPAHDLHPMGIVKDHTTQSGDEVDNSRHLLLTLDPKTANRVFRAPAYFRNGEFGKSVFFNASVAFAGSFTKDAVTYVPHKGLTAIDFTGKGDVTGYSGVVPGDIADFKDRSNNYAPLLDYYGLDGIRTSGITRNLLAYAPTAAAITGSSDDEAVGIAKAQTAATTTLGVLTSYFNDPLYEETDENYRTVDVVTEVNLPKGHLVQMSGNHATDSRTYTATNDHLLVDKQDFNAPIAYDFGDDVRMWYQRTPDTYVDRTKGWEGISLPFSAELVTTQTKGEITHFYGGSEVSKNSTATKIGHEYWLRQLASGGTVEDNVYKAKFRYPDAISDGDDKVYENTFLWDYYYKKSNRLDTNSDTYQEYYSGSHTYEDYGYSAAAKPYIIGFPGATYYEFDLSGTFRPEIPLQAIDRLARQVITFASKPGITIGVSDDECESGKTTDNGLSFHPSYLNQTFKAGTADTYTLNAEGSCYDKVPAAAADGEPAKADTRVSAFRPYFTGTPTSARTRDVEQIVFGMADDSVGGDEDRDPTTGETGRLDIRPGKGKIVVTSTLRYATDVHIVNVAGITLRTFTIKPGETIETPVNLSGVYIVNRKKITVKL